jgi:hypothetical protein
MKRVLIPAVSLAFAFASAVVQADVPQTASAPQSAAQAPADGATLFTKQVFLRGTLGDMSIQATIRPKAVIDEGIEGEYFVFGRSLKVLLAGEIEGADVFMEESENGTDVSGQWDGKVDGDTFAGTWMSADGSVTKPFALKVLPVNQSAATPQRAASSATKP